MRKRMMAVLLAGLLAGFYSLPVAATEQAADEASAEIEADDGTAEGDNTADAVEGDSTVGAAEGDDAADAGDAAGGDEASKDAAVTTIVIPEGNLVDVDVIDLALHEETTGDRTPVYAYENPFRGKDTSKGGSD